MSTKITIATQVQGIHKLVLPTPFPVGPVNVYVVEDEAVTLFDIGPKSPEAWDVFENQLNKAGFAIQDIDQVVLTHHHVDHIGMLDYLLEKHPVPVYAHPIAAPWLRQDAEMFAWHREFFSQLYTSMGVGEEFIQQMERFYQMWNKMSCHVELTGSIQEGQDVLGLPNWTVLDAPGHAQSHLIFYRKADSTLLAGDVIIKHVSPNAILENPTSRGGQRPKTLLQFRETLQRLQTLDVQTVFSGHGEEVLEMHALIDERIHQQEQRANQLLQWIREDQTITGYELCKRMFPRAYQRELALTMSEVIGHLDLLEAANKIKMVATDAGVRFKI